MVSRSRCCCPYRRRAAAAASPAQSSSNGCVVTFLSCVAKVSAVGQTGNTSRFTSKIDDTDTQVAHRELGENDLGGAVSADVGGLLQLHTLDLR